MQYNVEIIGLPVKYCCSNPIELCWANPKDYVRKNNTPFRMTNVRDLAAKFFAGYESDASFKAMAHTRKIEDQFRDDDRFVEEPVESDLVDCISDNKSDISSKDDDENNSC